MVWKFLELIQFLVSSNQPQHQQLDWTVAVGMDKPRKAREKERGGIFEAHAPRRTARVNILVGIGADEAVVSTRGAGSWLILGER